MTTSRSGWLALMLTGFALVLGNPEAAHADLIQYDAASGLLPSDPSIPADRRLTEEGAQFGFSSVSNGVLRIHDTSTTNETKFFRTSPPVASATPAAFEVTLRVISANRPGLNIAGDVGFLDGSKSVRIGFEPDRVGFTNRTGSAFTQAVAIDTSVFHRYRVIKNGNSSIQLYIDDMQTPVLDFPYSQLGSLNSGTPLRAHLWQGSNAGRSEIEMTRFGYNPNGTEIPEPSTIALALAVGVLIAGVRRPA